MARIGGKAVEATVQITGRMVNADTGKGVKDAWVVILVQGTEIQDGLENPSEREIAASATTDKKGYYETAPAIPPASTHSSCSRRATGSSAARWISRRAASCPTCS